MDQLVGGYSEKEWFLRLNDEEKKYIIDHPDPSHMIFYLKQGLSFKNSLMRGYKDYIIEDNIQNNINKINDPINNKLLS